MFASAGFTDRTADAFVAEIRRLASSGKVSETEDTLFGRSASMGPVTVRPFRTPARGRISFFASVYRCAYNGRVRLGCDMPLHG